MGGRGVGTIMEAHDVAVCIPHSILKQNTHNNEEETEDEKERRNKDEITYSGLKILLE